MTPTAAAQAKQGPSMLRDRLKDPALLREARYIDGAWVGPPSFSLNNPATGMELAKVPQLSAHDCTRAVEAAERAFLTWAKHKAKQRSNILRKWYELIVANREELAIILSSEQGKPLCEALGEVDIGGAYVEFLPKRRVASLAKRYPRRARVQDCLRSNSRLASAAQSRRGISPTR
ncbi:acyl-CoA reductase-like NAD-dependent aldehyde dehydrogenase [Bradyrhizobium yuanmingense]